jgi:hypothetical protein
LEQRGEDFEDCSSFSDLVRLSKQLANERTQEEVKRLRAESACCMQVARAKECEYASGPAKKPTDVEARLDTSQCASFLAMCMQDRL